MPSDFDLRTCERAVTQSLWTLRQILLCEESGPLARGTSIAALRDDTLIVVQDRRPCAGLGLMTHLRTLSGRTDMPFCKGRTASSSRIAIGAQEGRRTIIALLAMATPVTLGRIKPCTS